MNEIIPQLVGILLSVSELSDCSRIDSESRQARMCNAVIFGTLIHTTSGIQTHGQRPGALHFILQLTETFSDIRRWVELAQTGKVVHLLFLTEHHAVKAYWGSEGIALRILDLDTRWR